ncbi:unnamed protein product, partial [Phaeothamnion confervicola]
VLEILAAALPGACLYVGLLQRGGDDLHYVAASRNSDAAGKRLERGQGVSFRCTGARF